MGLTAMCFCLLPVIGSDLNFLLHREEYSLEFCSFLYFVDILIKNQLFSKMASGISPPGQPSFKIQPLQPESKIPSGRREDWLSKHDHK